MGATKAEVLDSCPVELEYYIEAAKIRKIERDNEAWTLGMYIQCAVSVAIEHNFAGKKAKSKYIERPVLSTTDQEGSREQEKIQQQRNQFMAQLNLMKANFEIEKKRKEVENNADSRRTCDTD